MLQIPGRCHEHAFSSIHFVPYLNWCKVKFLHRPRFHLMILISIVVNPPNVYVWLLGYKMKVCKGQKFALLGTTVIYIKTSQQHFQTRSNELSLMILSQSMESHNLLIGRSHVW